MTELTYAGVWWLPDDPDDTQPGILRIEPDGSSNLELVGGFDTHERTEYGNGLTGIGFGFRDIPVVHGLSEGKSVTLLKPITTSSRGDFGERPIFHRMEPQRVLVGVLLDGVEDEVFTEAVVRLENLTSWVGTANLRHTVPWHGENGFEAHIETAEPLIAEDDRGWKYIAETSSSGFRAHYTRASTTLVGDNTTVLRVIASQPSRASDFDRVALEMMDLLTLAMGQPCGVIAMHLTLAESREIELPAEDGNTRHVQMPVHVDEYGPRVHTADPTAEASKGHNVRFSCQDMPFSQVVSRWLALRRKTAAACNVFFGMSYSPQGYVETRLLTSAVTAEALHGALYGAEEIENLTGLSPEAITGIREQVGAILDVPEHRRWVLDRLNAAPSFRDRMASLARHPDAEAVKTLIPEIASWTRQLRDTRNGLAHSGGTAAGGDRFSLMWHTRGMIALVFMHELGLSADVQQRSANLLRLP